MSTAVCVCCCVVHLNTRFLTEMQGNGNLTGRACSGVYWKKMISIPNGEDTVDFKAFPPSYIKSINIHLSVSEWNRQRACTASYTPSAIDSAISWRMEEKNTERVAAGSLIAERLLEKTTCLVQLEEKRDVKEQNKKLEDIKKCWSF